MLLLPSSSLKLTRLHHYRVKWWGMCVWGVGGVYVCSWNILQCLGNEDGLFRPILSLVFCLRDALQSFYVLLRYERRDDKEYEKAKNMLNERLSLFKVCLLAWLPYDSCEHQWLCWLTLSWMAQRKVVEYTLKWRMNTNFSFVFFLLAYRFMAVAFYLCKSCQVEPCRHHSPPTIANDEWMMRVKKNIVPRINYARQLNPENIKNAMQSTFITHSFFASALLLRRRLHLLDFSLVLFTFLWAELQMLFGANKVKTYVHRFAHIIFHSKSIFLVEFHYYFSKWLSVKKLMTFFIDVPWQSDSGSRQQPSVCQGENEMEKIERILWPREIESCVSKISNMLVAC